MSSPHTRRLPAGILATIASVALTASAASARRPEGASFSIAATRVTLAGRCDLQTAIATVHVRAHNRANAPSSPMSVRVLDSAHALAGSGLLPGIAAHESRSIDVPVSLDPDSASRGAVAVGGEHTFAAYLSDPQSVARPSSSDAEASITIPAEFCARSTISHLPTSSSLTKASGPSPATSRTFVASQAQTLFAKPDRIATVATAATVDPRAATTIGLHVVPLVAATPDLRLRSVTRIGMTPVLFAPPVALRAVTGEDDCYGHVAAHYAFRGTLECRAMIAGGNLVLIWDAPSNATADGYRLYSVGANGVPGPLAASVHDPAQTLAQMPSQGSGYAGRCYVVTATYGRGESAPTYRYCAGGSSTTRTQIVGTTYTRYSFRERSRTGIIADFKPGDNMPDASTVGYYHASATHTLGDSSYNKIRRYAVAFDVEPFKTKRLVSATLHFAIQQSYGAGNNHSCATTVASGVEFWWKDDAAAWLEGNFAVAARVSDTGPIVNADVTNLVAPMLAGNPNYGFVVRNDDENLDAFMNAQCETVYGNPQLEIVYYDR